MSTAPSAVVLDGCPQPFPEELVERSAQYQNTRGAGFAGFLPTASDPSILIATRFAETTNIHKVSKPLGMRKQLTFSHEPIGTAYIRPDSKNLGFVFLRDKGGNEQHQIVYFNMQSGRQHILTDGVSKHGSPVWNDDGTKLAFFSSMKNGKDFDIYVLGVGADGRALGAPVCVMDGFQNLRVEAFQRSSLLVRRSVSINEAYLTLITLDADCASVKSTVSVVPEGGAPGDKIAIYSSAFLENTATGALDILVCADAGEEYLTLRRHDATGKHVEHLTNAKDLPWNVESVTVQGSKFAFVTNENGQSRIFVVDNASADKTHVQVPLPEPGVVDGVTFNADGSLLGFDFDCSTSPADVYVWKTDNSAPPTRWTEGEVGGLDTSLLLAPEHITFPSFDGLSIPCWYYRPRGASKDAPAASVIVIHGGPESQSRPQFVPFYQYLCCELGIAVLVPNVRGSSGYSKTYLLLDNGYKREDSVKDIGHLITWAQSQPELDPKRIAVTGGSYGGYMTLASLIHFGDRLKCGAECVGISNFVTFLEKTSPYRRDHRREEYGDERDPDMRKFLLAISPTTRAHEIKVPLCVSQGLNDPRVPASESEQIVQAVRSNGQEVWYMLAKNEGHGFHKKENRDFWFNMRIYFFMKLL